VNTLGTGPSAGRDPPGQARLRQLADEQAALRRVATLVARGVPPERVFAAVTREAGRVLSAGEAHLGRYEPDGAVTFVAAWGPPAGTIPVGSRLDLGGKNVTTLVFETGRSSVEVEGKEQSWQARTTVTPSRRWR
jgi:hypothetical protein